MKSQFATFDFKRILFPLLAGTILYVQPVARLAARTVTQVSGGDYFCLFVKSDGSLWGMGYNGYGQLGIGPTPNYTNAPQLIVASNVVAVAAGSSHGLFIKSDGSLWGMGRNDAGQLGDGSNNNRYYPVQIFASNVVKVAAGYYHSLFITRATGGKIVSSTVWAMGSNLYGQLGDGTTTSTNRPKAIRSSNVFIPEAIAIAAGWNHSLFEESDGSLWVMGDNYDGELGLGSGITFTNLPTSIVSDSVTKFAAGSAHSFYLQTGGSLWAMGLDENGELGDGHTYYTFYTPIPVYASNIVAAAAGYSDSLFIKSDLSLWGVGYNGYGELGESPGNPSSPVEIVASNVVTVAAGYYSTYFIKGDGTLWALGRNYDGELGDGTVTERHSPVQVVPPAPPLPTITRVSLSGKNLVMDCTNGQNGRTYYALMSTNIGQPLSGWIPIATNALYMDGSFSINVNNTVDPNASQQFYVLRLQN